MVWIVGMADQDDSKKAGNKKSRDKKIKGKKTQDKRTEYEDKKGDEEGLPRERPQRRSASQGGCGTYMYMYTWAWGTC